MAQDQRFSKYQWITANVRKASDPRPESYTPDLDSLQIASEIMPTTNAWAARRAAVERLIGLSMCELQRNLRGKRGQSATLGLVKPRTIDRLLIRVDDPEWSVDDLARLRQNTFWANTPTHELEKMPVKFTYEFHCEETACNGHRLRCTDWEMAQTWRGWRRVYGDEWERPFMQKFFAEMVERNNTHFFVGTHSLYPTWMVIGLFYPPKTEQPILL